MKLHIIHMSLYSHRVTYHCWSLFQHRLDKEEATIVSTGHISVFCCVDQEVCVGKETKQISFDQSWRDVSVQAALFRAILHRAIFVLFLWIMEFKLPKMVWKWKSLQSVIVCICLYTQELLWHWFIFLFLQNLLVMGQ